MRVTTAADIGKSIRTRRLDLGLSCLALSKRIDCSRATIHKIEKGESGMPLTLRCLEVLELELEVTEKT